MKLPPDQVERFYAIWKPLMQFVNQQRGIFPELLADDAWETWDPNQIIKIRDALWADDSLLLGFIAENPGRLPAEDLNLVESWQARVSGPFFVFRHLKKYSVFLKDSTAYGVLGLTSSFDELVPYVPYYLQTVLLPFEGRIIFDSLISGYSISSGRGIRESLNDSYRNAKARGGVITSLEPTTTPVSASLGRHGK